MTTAHGGLPPEPSISAESSPHRADFLVALRLGGQQAPVVAKAAHVPEELCCIVTSPGAVEIVTDAGGLYAVFGDRLTGVFSSSLAVVVRKSGRKYPVNRNALIEQLIIGAVSGRDTLFQGVERLDGCGTVSVLGQRMVLSHSQAARPRAPGKWTRRRFCIDLQVDVLRERFRRIADMAGAGGVSMGLSGGYDSRLMLALALEAGIAVSPFTFSSPNHHREQVVAGELAAVAGLELRDIPVRPLAQLDESALGVNIDDALVYYDGRTNDTMGTFADVHTARVHLECVGQAAMNLNGLGGELYRNRERLPRYSASFTDWFWHYVVGPRVARCFWSDSECDVFQRRMAVKYGELMGTGTQKHIDRSLARRWYRNVWLPYFAGPRLSAENRVAPALMPFADGVVSAAALAATPFVGAHGQFEAALIARINKRLAEVPSSYGHSFAWSAKRHVLRDSAAASMPLWLRRVRHQVMARRAGKKSAGIPSLNQRFAESLRLLRGLELPLDIEVLLRDQVTRDRTLYIAEFLHPNRAYIDLG